MKLILIFPLLILIISDLISRKVYLWNLVLFGVLQVIFTKQYGPSLAFHNILFNTIISIIMSLLVWLYMKFRFKYKKEIIGWGDILFIWCMTPVFFPRNFLLFLISSFMFTLIIWFVVNLFKRTSDIPLISGVGIWYLVVIFNPFHFMNYFLI